ncbi:MAG: hypothetical protein AVDCRST_MAG06-213 [uncultured Nocardioides sp.]|uniref:Uncharacterized protein n=1 Tax=uncultured Nocardioides sp. TaxID=198441 RepID=A0A6J4MZ10_9ACTN|nr:MAG: hypothetical protein AVDCRST_MAG06-213 [uncultured Nocardioides sp.]
MDLRQDLGDGEDDVRHGVEHRLRQQSPVRRRLHREDELRD